VTSLVANKKQTAPVRCYFYLLFHCTTSCSWHTQSLNKIYYWEVFHETVATVFKLCEESHGGHYLGHSQTSAEFRGVDKLPRRNTWTIAIAELALTVKLYWFYWSAEELRGRYLCQSLNINLICFLHDCIDLK